MTDAQMPSFEEAALLAHDAEQSFKIKVADRDATNAEIGSLLQRYRTACENLIFTNIAHAKIQKVEDRLWNAHSRVNDRFRKQLKKLRENGGTHVVEKRKLLKEYLSFIKTSQLFYREYVLHLDQRYGGIAALRKEAQNWKHNSIRAAPIAVTDPEVLKLVLISCHRTLIMLGDLSRYRASDIDDKPNWSHAVGYYSLATEVNPASGSAHNQQAIIAKAENDHFRTLYHLYRAVSTYDGHPAAAGNLEKEFKKVRSAWKRGELVNTQGAREDRVALHALIAWFIRLHSRCYAGEDFNEHDELEGEVLSQLAILLKERSLEGNLHKIVLVNMSAEYFAMTQLEENGGNEQNAERLRKAYFFFLRLNIKTFFSLLQVLQPELERLAEGGSREDVTGRDRSRNRKLSDKVTAVAHRILPAIRLYSVWFLKIWRVLVDDITTTMTQFEVQELFKAYTNTLTLLASAFPAKELPSTAEEYLLEEDADTVGYKPLFDGKSYRNWYTDDRTLKRSWSDRGVERHHPNEEMLIRIRDLLVDGLELAQDAEAPIDLVELRFVYRETGLPSELLASPKEQPYNSPDNSVEMTDIQRSSERRSNAEDEVSHGIAPSEANSTALSKDTALNRMVDDLVGDDNLGVLPEEDEINLPPTPLEATFDDTALINDQTYGITPETGRDCSPLTSKMTPGSPFRQITLPSLPDQSGIWNPQYPLSNPGSPYMGNGTGLASRNSTVNLSAMKRASTHSRNPSRDSNAPTYGPVYDAWNSSVTVPQTSSTNNMFGGPLHGLSSSQNNGMASSILFGKNGSSWNRPVQSLDRQRVSLGHTPPNGQGG